MIIDIEYIREKYPKCCIMISEYHYFDVNNISYYLRMNEFETLEEFEEKYKKVLNGLGYMVILEDNPYDYGKWKRESEKYFIYLCIV